MNKLFITLLFSAFLFSGDPGDSEGSGYAFIKREDGISLYYRWISVPEKLKVRELKAELQINSSPGEIISVLKNEKVATHWMKGTCEVNLIGKSGENQWYTYVQYNIPWPLSNQDCILKHSLKRDVADNSYFIDVSGMPRYLPAKEGITRIQHIEGSWRLTQVSKNVCKAEYTVYSAQAPKFPRWVTDPIVQGNLISTLQAFKVTVEKNTLP